MAEWCRLISQKWDMDRDTIDNTIRAFKDRTPFRLFSIAIANGHRLEIDHCDVLVVRDGVALFVAPGAVPVIPDQEGVSQVGGGFPERSSS